MHRFYKMIVLVILAASGSPLISQSTLLNPISTLVDKSKAGNKLPAIIDNAGNTRGAGFNGENIFAFVTIYLFNNRGKSGCFAAPRGTSNND